MFCRKILVALTVLSFAWPAAAIELYTSTASRAGTGSVACRAVNVSGKSLERVGVILTELREDTSPSFTPHYCYDLAPGRTCSIDISTYEPQRYCRVVVDGGNKRSVRASMTLQDATGQTILTLPAE